MPRSSTQNRKRPTVWGMLLPILAIIIFAGVAMELVEKSEPPPTGAAVRIETGATLPELSIRRFEGESFTLESLNKKVVMINFWASWCTACLVEMPSIVKLREAYQDKGFEVIGVNMDENPAEHIDRFKKKFKMNFVMAVDEDQKLAELFDIHALPFTVIIDQGRKVLHLEVGDRDWFAPDFRARLEKWLNP